MGRETGIAWTDHTFNIAWGCTKVSAGCANCYADRDATRYGFKIWGKDAERRTFGEKHWAEPLKWNRDAERAGVRARVFCSSMCDVFEDHPTIEAERMKLWPLIASTPWLDWQLLTKRAERLVSCVPDKPWPNVWIGVSVEDQATADDRIPCLLRVPAVVRFVSAEPLLGPLDFSRIPILGSQTNVSGKGIDWLIVGGESGHGARACDVEWLRSVVVQCKASGVACFVKQLGAKYVDSLNGVGGASWRNDDFHRGLIREGTISEGVYLRDRKGGDPSEWPDALMVREFPTAASKESA